MSSDDEIEFPEPPEEFTQHTDSAAVVFPTAPNDELVFPSVPSSRDETDDAALEARLKRLNPNSQFTSKKQQLKDLVKPDDEHKSNADKVNDLLAMFSDAARVERGTHADEDDDDDDGDAQERAPPAAKPSKAKSAVKKSMNEYLAAAEAEQKGNKKTTQLADLNPDNIFMLPRSSDPAAAEARARARFDANQKRHNARIAQQVLRDAREAGIDPREIDPALYDNAALDSDLDDDGSSDSLELSDSE